MSSLKSDLPQGTLDLLVLKVVALGPLHGYGIAHRLQQLSHAVVQVQQGTLYPALHRLENRGLLASEWKMSDTGREAKFYRLTRKGRQAMDSEEASWRRLTVAIGLIQCDFNSALPLTNAPSLHVTNPGEGTDAYFVTTTKDCADAMNTPAAALHRVLHR